MKNKQLTDTNQQPSMKLSRSDKVQLLTTAFIVAGFVSSIYLIIDHLYKLTLTLPTHNEAVLFFQQWVLYSTPNLRYLISDLLAILYGAVLIGSVIVTTLRKMERLRLDRILSYITYMADGHYSERVPLKQAGNYKEVADSLNHLMDHIQEALERQKQSEQTKDELITNIGHDIRTPLTSIIGYLNVLRTADPLPEEEKQKFLSIAYKKAILMETLVNDLFDYTHSLEEKANIERVADIPLTAFLDQVSADFAHQAQKQNVHLSVDVQPEDLEGNFDPNKLARILNNLITNALKYGKGASTIKVKAYERPPTEENLTSTLLFEVRNNGQLLPEEEWEKIFVRSYRGDSSRTSNEPGSGLGLSIVKNFAHLHGGEAYAYIDQDDMVFVVEIPQ